MARTGLAIFLFLFAYASANLWNDVNQQALVHSLNELRRHLSGTHKTMSYDKNLATKANDWTSKCTGTSDPKLRHLYGVVFVTTSKVLSTSEFLDVFNSEATLLQRFSSSEFDRARNYTVLTGENATSIGCAVNKCGSKNFYGCLVNPKGDYPGKMPYKPSCKPTSPINCANKSFCGSYFDGCKMVDCGPVCPIPGQDRSQLTYNDMLPRVLKRDTVPIDWRTKGAVTAIRDQGQCGSCWAHAAVELIESQWAIRNGKLYDLSVQQLLSCSGAGSCGGGDPGRAVAWPSSNNNMVTASSFPYTGRDSSCSSGSPTEVVGDRDSRKYISSTEKGIEDALQYGPVGIGFRVEQPFYNYRSGVFTTPCDYKGGNHAVVIVGYGTTDKGQDYWIMKNSWGTTWGEDGYARVPKGINWCGIAEYNYQFVPGVSTNPQPLDPVPVPPTPVPTPPAPSPYAPPPPTPSPPYNPPSPSSDDGFCAQPCAMGEFFCSFCCQNFDDRLSCGGSPPPPPPPPVIPPPPAPVPPPPTPNPPPAPAAGTLTSYDKAVLSQDEQLWDATYTVFLTMQGDGNLVVYSNPPSPQTAIWSTQTNGADTPYQFVVQTDGNCVIYGATQGAIWTSGTNGRGVGPFTLTLNQAGQLTLTDSTGLTLWVSSAPVPNPPPAPAPTPIPNPPPAPAPVPSPPVSDTGSKVTPSQMNEIMTVHNNERALVGVAAITWDPEIARWAQTWSDRCNFQHSQRSGYGENIAMGSSGYTATALTQLWADEKIGYRCSSCCSGDTGHYTQMVWQRSTLLGCGMTNCPGMGGNFLVCQYSPQGNYLGQTPYPC